MIFLNFYIKLHSESKMFVFNLLNIYNLLQFFLSIYFFNLTSLRE